MLSDAEELADVVLDASVYDALTAIFVHNECEIRVSRSAYKVDKIEQMDDDACISALLYSDERICD